MAINFGMTAIPPADLLGRLEDWVKAKTGLSADAVFLSLAPDDLLLKFPPADQFITITPVRFPVWQGVVAGAGQSFFDAALPAVAGIPGRDSANLGFDALIAVTAFARVNSDQELRGSDLIRSSAFGLVKTATAAVGAIQFWTAPTDADPNVSYLREYMRIADGPSFVPRQYNNTFWCLCKASYEMRFTAAL